MLVEREPKFQSLAPQPWAAPSEWSRRSCDDG